MRLDGEIKKVACGPSVVCHGKANSYNRALTSALDFNILRQRHYYFCTSIHLEY